jgi:hypothetical protein
MISQETMTRVASEEDVPRRLLQHSTRNLPHGARPKALLARRAEPDVQDVNECTPAFYVSEPRRESTPPPEIFWSTKIVT